MNDAQAPQGKPLRKAVGENPAVLIIALVVAAVIGYYIGFQQLQREETSQVAQLAKPTAEAPAPTEHILLTAADLQWKDVPPVLLPGAKIVVLEGKPSEPGPFTLRLMLPPNYKVSPHFHPADEHATVLSGTFYVGTGDTFDEKNMKELPEGGFMMMPRGSHHFARTAKEGAVIQLHGIGPWGLTYVNPEDDPSRK